jgi:hypothetical protein
VYHRLRDDLAPATAQLIDTLVGGGRQEAARGPECPSSRVTKRPIPDKSIRDRESPRRRN